MLGKQALIFFAIHGGDRKVIEFLIDMGADLEIRSQEGLTVAEAAVEMGNTEVLAALQRAKVPPASLASALLRACASPHEQAARMTAKLVAMGAPATAAAPDGATALHFAAVRGDVAAVEALVRAGAAVDARTKAGATPLLLAAMEGRAPVMRALLEGGASVSLPNESRLTPLFIAAHEGHIAVRGHARRASLAPP